MKTLRFVFLLAMAVAAVAWEPDGAGLEPGALPDSWRTAAANCVTTPHWEVNAYNENFYILRESHCYDEEKPFLFLIFGESKALLLDTGIQSAELAEGLIAKWAARNKRAPVPLVVIHTHGHADHLAGDKDFEGKPGVELIAASPGAVSKAAGISSWPNGIGSIDLGKRVVDVIPIPGHEASSIALYDRRTGILMTGDSVYPGRLHVAAADIPVFAASARRMVEFARTHPIAHVLGAHVEQTQIPFLDFPTHAPQPQEHALALSRAHLFELDAAFTAMGGSAEAVILPDLILDPRRPNTASSPQSGNTMGLEAGALPAKWLSGGPDCLAVPDWQVAEYNPDFLILRESGCAFYDKPFLYLVFGQEKALLFDTGGGNVPIAPFVQNLLAAWAKQNQRKPVSLLILHSHSHGGHTAGDKQFAGMPGVELVTHTVPAIQVAAGIAKWPGDLGSIDLGGRIVEVIPIPGHTADSIALYDRKTGNLLTGDSLFAGRLCVDDAEFAEFGASTKRLAEFAASHPVAHVLGAHVEQTNTPFREYPAGVIYQPAEHALALSRAHIFELNEAVIEMHGKLVKAAYPDFTIVPEGACGAAPPAR